jgi:hypothetical protein
MTQTPPEPDDGGDAAVAALDHVELESDPEPLPVPVELLTGDYEADEDPDPDDEGTTDDEPDSTNTPGYADHAAASSNWLVDLVNAIARAFGKKGV